MSREFEVPGFKPGVLKAGADLSGDQFRAVSVAADGDVEGTGAGASAIGILQNKPVANEAAEIEVDGISKGVAGAAVANAGTELMSDANGKLIAATSGNRVIALNLTPASGDGAIMSVLVLGASGRAIP